MNKLQLILGICTLFFLFQCEKEDEIPCTSFPCDEVDIEEVIKYNRVAYHPAFRIGTWTNVRASATGVDTVIFHNDSTWSLYNELGGYFNQKYSFNGLYLVIETDVDGSILSPTINRQTKYNDSTGVFSILQQQNIGYQQWNHYIKVE